jgi:predicted RNA-binding protein with PUA-like domain
VDLAPVKAFVKAVPLEVIKADALLAGIPLVRQSRLSVSALTKEQFTRVLALGGTKL